MQYMMKLIGRDRECFSEEIVKYDQALRETVRSSRFLVIGGGGSIGQSVTREIFRRDPLLLHVVDISENNLVELVRDLRSSIGYSSGEFATYALDVGSDLFDSLIKNGPRYDYILNLSALKHVRSEKDPYTLMRMIEVNIFNTDKTLVQAAKMGATKYFCVSTDKAANPVNMMGASKRIMEMFLMRRSLEIPLSTARFANVAFSDGSLLYGFGKRVEKEQPISAPNDVRRYFITSQESGELCLLSCLLGENRDVFFPKLDSQENLITFSEIADRYLRHLGYEPVICASEEEARSRVKELKPVGKWPVYFFTSDTTGEKDFEEFYTHDETLDLDRFSSIGVVKNRPIFDKEALVSFEREIGALRNGKNWDRNDIIAIFKKTIPEFSHKETFKFLEGRM